MASRFEELETTLNHLVAHFGSLREHPSPQGIVIFYELYDSLPEEQSSILFNTEYLNRKMDEVEGIEIIVGDIRDSMIHRLTEEAKLKRQPIDEADRILSQYDTLARTCLPTIPVPPNITKLQQERIIVAGLEERVGDMRKAIDEPGFDRQALAYVREGIVADIDAYSRGVRTLLRRAQPLIDVGELRTRAFESLTYNNRELDKLDAAEQYQFLPHLLLYGAPPDSLCQLFEQEVLADAPWQERFERIGKLAMNMAAPSARGQGYLSHLQKCLAKSAAYGELQQYLLDDQGAARAYERMQRSLTRTLNVTTT